MNSSWTLEEALGLYRRLSPVATSAGFGLGLTGGVLRNGSSDHDVDVIVYPLQSPAEDVQALKAAMVASGMQLYQGREQLTARWRSIGSADEKWVEVWQLDGKRVDVFFLR